MRGGKDGRTGRSELVLCSDCQGGNEVEILIYFARLCAATNSYKLSEKPMDKDERLLKILGKLSGGRLEDVADKLMALFREPEWWEEEFEKQFVARGSIEAFQDAD